MQMFYIISALTLLCTKIMAMLNMDAVGRFGKDKINLGIGDLRDLADHLKTLKAGDEISINLVNSITATAVPMTARIDKKPNPFRPSG